MAAGIKKPPVPQWEREVTCQRGRRDLRYHAEKQCHVTSDRSPGSWVQKVGPSPRPPAFPDEFVEWLEWGSLSTYSGGTAPVFHRTSLLRPCGHPRGYSVIERGTYRRRAGPVNLKYRRANLKRLLTAARLLLRILGFAQGLGSSSLPVLDSSCQHTTLLPSTRQLRPKTCGWPRNKFSVT